MVILGFWRLAMFLFSLFLKISGKFVPLYFKKCCVPRISLNVFPNIFFSNLSVIYHINNIYIARISCHLHLGLYIYYFTFQYIGMLTNHSYQYWQYCRSDACFTDFNTLNETDIDIHVCGTYRGQILRQISTLRQWRCGYCSWQLWCRPLTLYNISLKKFSIKHKSL